jgi:hypothetical protein
MVTQEQTTLVGLTEEDEQALREWADVESAAFESYADAYNLVIVRVCKGCHGG